MKAFNIAGVSFWPELWKPRQNLERLLPLLREAREMGADVVATPEGIIDGYISRDLEKNRIREQDRGTKGFKQRLAKFRKRQLALASKIRKQVIPALQKEAADLGIFLFANTLDLRGKSGVYNTTFVMDPRGNIIGKYDKIHAAFEVANTLGKAHKVFETPFAPIGVIICADRQFPEAPRSTALAGARVLIINSYGMWGEGKNERFIRQRAYENGFFVLFCHPGETVLVSPEGRIIAATCEWESVLVRRIDPSESVGRGLFGSPKMVKTYLTASNPELYKGLHREHVKRKMENRGIHV